MTQCLARFSKWHDGASAFLQLVLSETLMLQQGAAVWKAVLSETSSPRGALGLPMQ